MISLLKILNAALARGIHTRTANPSFFGKRTLHNSTSCFANKYESFGAIIFINPQKTGIIKIGKGLSFLQILKFGS